MWLCLVVLAAWFGSRYGGLKQIDWFGPQDEPIILYSVYDAIQAWFDHVVFVIREEFAEEFQKAIWSKIASAVRVSYVYQRIESCLPEEFHALIDGREKPWWTAHAMLVAKEVVDSPFAVINADDFYGRDGFNTMAAYLQTIPEHHIGMIGYVFINTVSPFWAINRWVCDVADNGTLVSITERLHIHKTAEGVYCDEQWTPIPPKSPVSMNFWWFHPSFFLYVTLYFKEFLATTWGRGEYFIPLVVDKVIDGHGYVCDVMMSHDQRCGVSYQEDKPFVQQTIAALHKQWVYPDNLFV